MGWFGVLEFAILCDFDGGDCLTVSGIVFLGLV